MLDNMFLDFEDNGIKIASYSTRKNIIVFYVSVPSSQKNHIFAVLPSDVSVINLFDVNPCNIIEFAKSIIENAKECNECWSLDCDDCPYSDFGLDCEIEKLEEFGIHPELDSVGDFFEES